MNRHALLFGSSMLALGAVVLSGCGRSSSASRETATAEQETAEVVYRRGHQLYLQQQFDSAIVLLRRSVAMDGSASAPLGDLGAAYYARAMQVPEGAARRDDLHSALDWYGKCEAKGNRESETYERLCEIAVALDDTKAFVRYARKNADLFPYDRQYHNLGLAYFNAGDYQDCIKTQKEAVGKFKESPYIGGLYRQLGRAYMKVDRDQTAERVFTEGLAAANTVLMELQKRDGGPRRNPDIDRLIDDKIGILVSLRKLHQTYNAPEKLREVERQLKELGYTR